MSEFSTRDDVKNTSGGFVSQQGISGQDDGLYRLPYESRIEAKLDIIIKKLQQLESKSR